MHKKRGGREDVPNHCGGGEVALGHEPIVHALEDVGHVVDGVLELRLSITELRLPVEELLLLVEDPLHSGIGPRSTGRPGCMRGGRWRRRRRRSWTVVGLGVGSWSLQPPIVPNLDGETCGVGQQDRRQGVWHEQMVLVAHSRDHLHGLISGEVNPIPTLGFFITLQRKTDMQGDGGNESPKYYGA
ncbi:hypothetical protein Salat_0187800 [Sesamum alatum]|uniref:Uncharacterized protein n=1 Tax=Sesamum alatum TaxID=300844 RepID=A0AAE1YYC1_9LAMI|nr:hypothetical protein Salat_0187800 [Sesamum alatum]